MSPDWDAMGHDAVWEVSVLVFPVETKISRLNVAALVMAGPAFDDVERHTGWTVLWKGARRPLVVERTSEIHFADATTNEGRDRQPLWGAEYRVGILKEGVV